MKSLELEKIKFILKGSIEKAYIFIVVFFLASLIDVLSLAMVGKYVSLMVGDENGQNEIIVILRYIYPVEGLKEAIILLSGLIILIFSIKSYVSIKILKLIAKYSAKVQSTLRKRLAYVYLNEIPVGNKAKSSSEYIYNIDNLVYQFSHLIIFLGFRSAADSIIALVISAYLFYINPMAFTILIIMFTIVFFIYDFIIKKENIRHGENANRHYDIFLNHVNNLIFGRLEIKAYERESYFLTKLNESSIEASSSAAKTIVFSAAPKYLVESMLIIFIVSITIYSTYTNDNYIDLFPGLAIFAVASLRLVPALNGLISTMSHIRYNKSSINRIYNDLQFENISKNPHESKIGSKSKFQNLEIKELNFGYDKNKPIYKNFCMSISRGEKIGIKGKSGSGKSTLINLLLGIVKPTSGAIIFNGNDITNTGLIKHCRLAYLPQKPLIMETSIKDNILFANNKIDEMRLQSAINKASIQNEGLSLESILSNTNLSLSGGQLQRLMIARALYQDADLFLLDEITSALDEENESNVINEILNKVGDATVLIISHNNEVLQKCDKVIEIF